jgi:shikimate dehydrogenase
MKFAVIGDPVAHSISPALHDAVFERLGIDARYDKIHVTNEELVAFAASLKAGKAGDGAEASRGVNVTIPHKKAILLLLDEVRGDALLAGAVNTVVREASVAPSGVMTGAESTEDSQTAGRLVGYNTDMAGLLLALERIGSGYKDKVVCIFGTGGAALGAAVKAAAEGAKTVRVIGRNKEKVAAVCARSCEKCENFEQFVTKVPDSRIICEAVVIDECGIPQWSVADADIFLNATPLGMQGYAQDFEDLGFLDALPKTALVYDCVYIPAETTLLRAARARGLKAENGLSMLVWQGLLADVHFLRAAGETRFTKAEILSPEMFSAVYQTLESVLNKH